MAELICMNSKVTLTFYRMRYKITEAKATGGEETFYTIAFNCSVEYNMEEEKC